MNRAVLAIDQGTTSTRSIVFDAAMRPICSRQLPLRQIFPADGLVEHDPEEIWLAVVETARTALAEATAQGYQVSALGITNQRETVVVWDRESGKAIHNAIVWQDRRTAQQCAGLSDPATSALVTERTGLLIDPYFSATKIAWILANVDGARAAATAGRLACGTIDSFLLWRMTGGQVHATDVTNASRTSLFSIREMQWDEELLRLFDVPVALLPDVFDCDHAFGRTVPAFVDSELPICGIAGDQQAALIGQRCFAAGQAKATYGTGGFVLLNTGDRIVRSSNRLISTVAYGIGGQVAYALEGSIFIAGAGVQWLRDGLGLIQAASETAHLASMRSLDSGVFLVPALTGLGAPHWLPNVRGAIFGLSRDTGPAEIAAAMLESVGYQSADLLAAMSKEGTALQVLRVDGGMAANDWMCQSLADILDLAVERPSCLETTAVGAAALASHGAGLSNIFASLSRVAETTTRFEPAIRPAERERKLAKWRDAIDATKLFSQRQMF